MKRLSLAILMGFVSSFAFAVTPSNGTLQRMIEQAIAARQQPLGAMHPMDCYDPEHGTKSGLVIRLLVPTSLLPDWSSWTPAQRAWAVGEICDAVWDEADRR